MQIKCPYCSNIWTYTGSAKTIKCPNCGKRVTVKPYVPPTTTVTTTTTNPQSTTKTSITTGTSTTTTLPPLSFIERIKRIFT
jgi:DNA-directed RNA polymerase subunit RPC12/RpoP